MPKLGYALIRVCALVCLTGCQGIPFSPGSLLLAMPTLQEIKTKDYTVGPVSSPEFSELLHRAIDSKEGEVHIFGRASFLFSGYIFDGVAVITDESIILLKWHKLSKEFKVIEIFVFSEILTISINEFGFGRVIYLEHAELSFDKKSYGSNQNTSLSFSKATGISQDTKITDAAFNYLKKKIKVKINDTEELDSAFDYELY